MTIVTVVVVLVVAATVEEEVVRVLGIAGIERTGPVVAARAVIAELGPVEVARSGEIDDFAVLYANNFIAIDGFTCGVGAAFPSPCAVVGTA